MSALNKAVVERANNDDDGSLRGWSQFLAGTRYASGLSIQILIWIPSTTSPDKDTVDEVFFLNLPLSNYLPAPTICTYPKDPAV